MQKTNKYQRPEPKISNRDIIRLVEEGKKKLFDHLDQTKLGGDMQLLKYSPKKREMIENVLSDIQGVNMIQVTNQIDEESSY